MSSPLSILFPCPPQAPSTWWLMPERTSLCTALSLRSPCSRLAPPPPPPRPTHRACRRRGRCLGEGACGGRGCKKGQVCRAAGSGRSHRRAGCQLTHRRRPVVVPVPAAAPVVRVAARGGRRRWRAGPCDADGGGEGPAGRGAGDGQVGRGEMEGGGLGKGGKRRGGRADGSEGRCRELGTGTGQMREI